MIFGDIKFLDYIATWHSSDAQVTVLGTFPNFWTEQEVIDKLASLPPRKDWELQFVSKVMWSKEENNA